MNDTKHEFMVGTVILAALAVCIAIVVYVGATRKAWVGKKTYTITLDNVRGLKEESPVLFSGYKVGHVQSLKVLENGKVEVSALMQTGLPLTEKSRAVVKTPLTGLGETKLEIIPGQGAPMDPARTTIDSEDTADIAEMMASLDGLVKRLDKVLGHERIPKILEGAEKGMTSFDQAATALKTILQENQEPIKQILQKKLPDALDRVQKLIDMDIAEELLKKRVYGAVEELQKSMAAMRSTIEKNDPKLSRTLENAESATGKVDKFIDAEKDKLSETFANLQKASGRLQSALSKAEQFMDSANVVLGDNRDELRQMVKNLKASSVNLEQMSADLRRNPWKLFTKPPKGEADRQSLYEAARSLQAVSEDLNATMSRLEKLAASKDKFVRDHMDEIRLFMQMMMETFHELDKAKEQLKRENLNLPQEPAPAPAPAGATPPARQ